MAMLCLRSVSSVCAVWNCIEDFLLPSNADASYEMDPTRWGRSSAAVPCSGICDSVVGPPKLSLRPKGDLKTGLPGEGVGEVGEFDMLRTDRLGA